MYSIWICQSLLIKTVFVLITLGNDLPPVVDQECMRQICSPDDTLSLVPFCQIASGTAQLYATFRRAELFSHIFFQQKHFIIVCCIT